MAVTPNGRASVIARMLRDVARDAPRVDTEEAKILERIAARYDQMALRHAAEGDVEKRERRRQGLNRLAEVDRELGLDE